MWHYSQFHYKVISSNSFNIICATQPGHFMYTEQLSRNQPSLLISPVMVAANEVIKCHVSDVKGFLKYCTMWKSQHYLKEDVLLEKEEREQE